MNLGNSRGAMLDRLKPHIVPILLLLASACAVYAQALSHDFLINWDDRTYVTSNEAVRGLTFEHLGAAFSNYYVGNYAPLHIISYMLDYSLWGMKAAGFIFTNILLHAMNGMLYYYLLIRITGRRIWAVLAAFIFISHPVQVESVAWISQRKNVLAMFFFLIAFLLYLAFRKSKLKSPDSGLTARGSLMYACSIIAFGLAMLTKSVAVILPPTLMLYDLCFEKKEGRRQRLARVLPFVALALLFAVVAVKSQSQEIGGGRINYHGGSPLATFFTMLPVFARYLGMLFWPTGLSAAYNPPVKTGIDGAVALSMLLMAAFCAAGFYLYRRRKDLFFWFAFFFVGLLPVSQIVPLVTFMNDRYLYFPMLGGAAFVAGAAVLGMAAFGGRTRKAAVMLLGLVILTLPVISFKRTQVWQNSLTLWTDAYRKAPDSAVVNCALAETYYLMGNLEAARSFYLRTLSISPLDREALQSISILYLKTGQINKAWPHIRQLVNTYPELAAGYAILGHYYLLTGDLQKAEDACRKGLALNPGTGFVWRYFGHVFLGLNNIELARESYRQALAVGGETPEVHYNLSYLAAVSGRTGEALKHLETALQLGYKDLNVIMKHPLLTLPEFQRLLAKYGKDKE